MDVRLATSSGHPGRRNEDFVGAVPGAVVLLDGAGIPGTRVDLPPRRRVVRAPPRLDPARPAVPRSRGGPRRDPGRRDRPGRRTAPALLRPRRPQQPAGDRGDRPVRRGARGPLVLADVFVVLDQAGAGPQVITDPREVDLRAWSTVPLRGLLPGTPEYERALPAVVQSLRARRNQPGGYWIAKDDPAAAAEAVTGSVDLRDLRGVATAQQRRCAGCRSLQPRHVARAAHGAADARPGGGAPSAARR